MNSIVAIALTALLLTPATTPVGQAIDAVVRVSTSTGTGSGFPISENEIVTAAHVVAGARTAEVRAGGQTIDADVIRVDRERDIALLRVKVDTDPFVAMALAEEPPTPGDEIYAIGYPLGDSQASVSRGIVSAVRDEPNGTHLQTDAAVNPGVSGGPAVGGDGAVLGMVVSKLDEAEGIGLAIAADELRSFIADDGGTLPPATPTGNTDGPNWLWATALLPILAIAALIRRRPKREEQIRITLGEARTRDTR